MYFPGKTNQYINIQRVDTKKQSRTSGLGKSGLLGACIVFVPRPVQPIGTGVYFPCLFSPPYFYSKVNYFYYKIKITKVQIFIVQSKTTLAPEYSPTALAIVTPYLPSFTLMWFEEKQRYTSSHCVIKSQGNVYKGFSSIYIRKARMVFFVWKSLHFH